MRLFAPALLTLLAFAAAPVAAEEIGCATTTWKLIGANHRVCVYAYDDPKVAGVTCHISQARTGGIKGSFGLAEDPSQFSIACRQVGPITLPAKLPERRRSVQRRHLDFLQGNQGSALLRHQAQRADYMAISRKIIEGAPANAISTVPIQPWGGK
jgi:CreA protein